MTAAFRLENISLQASRKTLLSVPSLSIAAGLITAVIGPNGAGKSTLLKLLNLLTEPSSGKLFYFSQLVRWDKKSRKQRLHMQREMSFVFQTTTLFDATVFHNVALGLKFRGYPQAKMEESVTWALELVDLLHLKNRHAHTLSGGEVQRMALARSLATRPRILLLDEATANLDPKNMEIFERVIRQIYQETKMTVIMVTHSLQQAKRLADECLFLYQGQILEKGTTEAFFHRPQSQQLQAFLAL
ncbi:hypothetical protein BSNK01_21380 [Bacillaceae bacterium]